MNKFFFILLLFIAPGAITPKTDIQCGKLINGISNTVQTAITMKHVGFVMKEGKNI